MKVVDASVAVKWVFDEPGSLRARALLQNEATFLAPRLWVIESANVLRRKASEGKLNAADVRARTALLLSLPVEVADERLLLDDALDLSLELEHALYDCLYLALARDRGFTLVTADAKFSRAATKGGYGPLIELIGPDQP